MPVHRLIEGLLLLALTGWLVGCDRPGTLPATPVTRLATPMAVASPVVSPTPAIVRSPSPGPTLVPTTSPRPISPAPSAVATPIVTPAPQLTEAPPPSPTLPPSPPAASPVPTLFLTPVTIPAPRAAQVDIASNRTVQGFPNKVTFFLEGSSAAAVKSVFLKYGTSKRSLASEVTRVEPQYGKETRITTSYSREMKKTGSIPPGDRIWWERS